jgi:PAS domain S-box-containing protein
MGVLPRHDRRSNIATLEGADRQTSTSTRQLHTGFCFQVSEEIRNSRKVDRPCRSGCALSWWQHGVRRIKPELHEPLQQICQGFGPMDARLRRALGAPRSKFLTAPGRNSAVRLRIQDKDPLHDFRLIIDSIPAPVVATRPSGEFESLNRLTQEYFGKTFEELKGWATSDIVHPDDLQRIIAAQREAHRTGDAYDVESRQRRADGVYRWFNILGFPLRDTQGRVLRWLHLLIDIDDRKRAEEALRAAERNLRSIINTIPTMAWSTRPDGHCDFLSHRWLDYAGFSVDQALVWGWENTIHPDDAGALVTNWQSCLATGAPVDTEARMRRFDGVYRWFLVRANPLRDESGDIVKWYGANVDIDHRKRADQALRASERSLSQIINTIPAMAWSARSDGSAEFFNQHYLGYVGLSAEQARGWGWGSAIHPDDVKGLMDYWQACLASGEPVDTEARMRRFDGEYRWFIFRASPLRDESGNIVKWYGTNTDIEDQKRANEALQHSEAFLAQGQRLNLTGSFLWRLDTDEITFSEELYRIFELDRDSPVTPEKIASRVHPEDIQLLTEKMELARREISDHDYEIRLRMPNGTIKYLRTKSHGIRDRNGRLEHIGAIQDVTKHRMSEEALGKARSELAHVARVTSLGVLTASIAHEVNQPLAAIITNGETNLRWLSRPELDLDKIREITKLMVADARRASEIIDRIRAMAARRAPQQTLLSINGVIQESMVFLHHEFQSRGISVSFDLAPELPQVFGDRTQLQQVIVNLAINAAQAMAQSDGARRSIFLRTALSDAETVCGSVEDSGPGIDPTHLPRLFDSFFTTKNTGMGMGLPICRSIIEAHDGQISADNNSAMGGARFQFALPANVAGGSGSRLENNK